MGLHRDVKRLDIKNTAYRPIRPFLDSYLRAEPLLTINIIHLGITSIARLTDQLATQNISRDLSHTSL